MRVLLLILGWALMPLSAQAQIETTIRVLGVYPADRFVNSAYMSTQLFSINHAWVETQLPISSGVTVTLLNGGAALPVALSMGSFPSEHQNVPRWAVQQAALRNIRDANSADLIILFTDLPNSSTGVCGAATTGWYNNNFIPNPSTDNLDLRYKEDYFVATVGISCDQWAGAHEIGHLLGGGHIGGPDRERLYSDSRASAETVCQSGSCSWQMDVLATGDECPSGTGCTRVIRHSRNSPGYGDDSHENARAFNLIGLSAANFRRASQPGGALNPPINLQLTVLKVCLQEEWTYYRLSWTPDPDTNVPIQRYEMWRSQPVGDPLFYSGSAAGSATSATFSIRVHDALMTVRACTTTDCSRVALPPVLADHLCGW